MDAGTEVDRLVFFKGEMQLAGWNESHNGGAKVVMWLPDSEALEPFKTATVRKGDKAGQRFAVVLVEIGDDEQPIPPQPRAAVAQQPKGAALCKLAALWAQTPAFQAWCEEHHAVAWADALERFEEPSEEELAAEVIRIVCDIGSRAELDHNPRAAAVFHERIRIPFSRTL